MSQQQVQDKHRAIKIIREVSNQAENFYEEAIAIGDHAAFAFGIREKKEHRSQLTNLETIAESALKVSDILDYIKRQTARQRGWRQSYKTYSELPLGDRLRIFLTENMQKVYLKTICEKLHISDQTDEDKQLQRHIYLQLIRQFIRQMIIEYEYRVSLDEESAKANSQNIGKERRK